MSSPHFTLLTPIHNLLCHPDLPALAIPNKPPPMDGAKWDKMSAIPLAQFTPAQVKAGGLTMGGQSPPSSTLPFLYPQWKHAARRSHLLCGQQKHFRSWTRAIKQSPSNCICGMPKRFGELCSLLSSVKGYVCCVTVSVMKHCVSQRLQCLPKLT